MFYSILNLNNLFSATVLITSFDAQIMKCVYYIYHILLYQSIKKLVDIFLPFKMFLFINMLLFHFYLYYYYSI
jgi:hypothetical protein